MPQKEHCYEKVMRQKYISQKDKPSDNMYA